MIWPVKEEHQREQMGKMWNFFHVGQGDPIHQRILWGKGVPNPRPPKNLTFTAEAYPCVSDRKQAFVDSAVKLNRAGYNVYTCFNPVSTFFGGNELNGLAVKDVDIVRRRFLLVDVDRADTGAPATSDELDEVFQVAGEIERDYFFSKGLNPITVNSGNGAHIYIPIDLPNDEASKFLCQKVLQALAAKYDTSTVKVDTSVFNAGRITKVPGSIARKGLEVEDPTGFQERCYRMAAFVE
jgi:hypothetical protein